MIVLTIVELRPVPYHPLTIPIFDAAITHINFSRFQKFMVLMIDVRTEQLLGMDNTMILQCQEFPSLEKLWSLWQIHWNHAGCRIKNSYHWAQM